MDRSEVNKLNKQLAKLSTGKLTLSDFVHQAQQLHPLLPPVFEGIYCGCIGKVYERIENTRYWLYFSWYADPNSSLPPKVEVAYIS